MNILDPLRWIAGGLGALALGLSAASADGLSLDAFLETVEARHPDLQAAQAQIDAARTALPLARALPDPKAFAMVEEMSGSTEIRKVGVEQAFPPIGLRDAQTDAANAELTAAEASRDQVRARLRGQAIRLWADYAALHEQIDVQRQRLALLERLEEVAEARMRAGASAGDLWRAEDRRESTADMLDTLDSRRAILSARMRALIREPADQPLPPPQTELGHAPNIPALADLTLDDTPRQRAARARESRQRAEITRAQRERRPGFMLMLEQQFAGDAGMANEDAFMASAAVSIPLWPGKNRARIDRADARHQAATAETASLADSETADVHGLHLDWQDAHRRQRFVREDLLPRAQNTLQVVQDAYRADQASFTDLLDAEERLLQHRLSEILAWRDALRAAAALESLGFHLFQGDPQ